MLAGTEAHAHKAIQIEEAVIGLKQMDVVTAEESFLLAEKVDFDLVRFAPFSSTLVPDGHLPRWT